MGSSKMTACLLVAMLALGLRAQSDLLAMQAEGSPGWTLERVREKVEASRQRLRSVYFESESVGRIAVSPPGVHQRRHVVVAVKGTLRYVEAAHISPGFNWTDDPEWTKSYLTEDTLDALWVLNRYYETSRKQAREPVSQKIRYEYFVECTGWWPPDDLTTSSDLVPAAVLSKALQNDGYRVHPCLETIGGQHCVVVEFPGRDKIWLDVERGCALVRREFAIAGRTSRSYVVYENSDFREVGRQIWLPWKLRRVIHRGPSAGKLADGGDAIWSDSTRTITRLIVNSLPDDIFVFEPAAGTLIVDLDQRKTSQIPGGQDLLDDVSRVGSKLARPTADPNGWSSKLVGFDLLLLLVSLPAWLLLGPRAILGFSDEPYSVSGTTRLQSGDCGEHVSFAVDADNITKPHGDRCIVSSGQN